MASQAPQPKGAARPPKGFGASFVQLPKVLSTPRNVTQSPLLVLSVVMIAFALMPLLEYSGLVPDERATTDRALRAQAQQDWLHRANLTWDPSKYWDTETPILFGAREPSTGLSFATDRLDKDAFLYGWLHIAPAIFWSIAIPTQHSITLRSRYPALHRWFGRVTLLSAAILTYSGVSFPFHDMSYSAGLWTTHRWGYLAWPSFNLVVYMAGLTWPPTMIMTYLTARNKDWKAHRAWATLHTFIGSVIPMQRVMMLVLFAFAGLAAYFPSVHKAFGLPKELNKEAFEFEQGAFSLTTWAAMPAVAAWAWQVYKRQEKAPIVQSKSN